MPSPVESSPVFKSVASENGKNLPPQRVGSITGQFSGELLRGQGRRTVIQWRRTRFPALHFSEEASVNENRLYGDLAHLWPIISPPENYAEEALVWREILREKLGPGRHEILELGGGGGHNLSHLTGDFRACAVDLSEAMLAHSRRLNPDVEHRIGDMRTVRLGRKFRAVLIHDAIDYMVTEDDLLRTFETAALHLDPGGVIVAAPDFVAETFQDGTVEHCQGRRGDLEVTYVEYVYDAGRTDNRYEALMFFIIRRSGGAPLVEQDRHVHGLFPLETWLRLLGEAGFDARVHHPEGFAGDRQNRMFVGRLR